MTAVDTLQNSHLRNTCDTIKNLELKNCKNFSIFVDERDMKNELCRINTFKNENWRCPFFKPSDLAKNGFYYTGQSDLICCAFCKIKLYSLQRNDDPARDHRKWSPTCSFLRGSVEACSFMEVRPFSNPENCPAPSFKKSQQGPYNPGYSTVESRLNTFKTWPKQLRPTPEQLAPAGFYYAGEADKTTCFYCNLGLGQWEKNDDPWKEHAMWSSKCAYVLSNKGSEFVKNVCGGKNLCISAKELNEIVKKQLNENQLLLA